MSQAQSESMGASRGSFRSYAIGFALSIVLTVVAFGLVMSGGVPPSVAQLGIVAAAVVQILVHLHYFLHLDTSSGMGWNLLALLLTVLIVALFVGGTLWIMHYLSYRLG